MPYPVSWLERVKAMARRNGKTEDEVATAIATANDVALKSEQNRGWQDLIYRRDLFAWKLLVSDSDPFPPSKVTGGPEFPLRSSKWDMAEERANAIFADGSIAPKVPKIRGWNPREYPTQVLLMMEKFLSSRPNISKGDFETAYLDAFRKAVKEIAHLKHPAYQMQYAAERKVWFALFGPAEPFLETRQNCNKTSFHMWWYCPQPCRRCGEAAHSPVIDCVQG